MVDLEEIETLVIDSNSFIGPSDSDFSNRSSDFDSFNIFSKLHTTSKKVWEDFSNIFVGLLETQKRLSEKVS